MFPEEGEKQKAGLEEESSVNLGLRERKKKVWGEKRRKKKSKHWRFRAHDATFLQSLLQSEVCQEKSHYLENRGVNTLVLTSGHVQHGIL